MKKLKKLFYSLQWKCHNRTGFSLVELIVVVAILAILAGAAYLALSGETPNARDAKRKSDLATIRAALESYYNKNNYYPQPAVRDSVNNKNVWGYRQNEEALSSCATVYIPEKDEIDFENTFCGGNVWDQNGENVIGWKGTLNETSAKDTIWAVQASGRATTMPFDSNYIDNIPRDPKLAGRKSFTDVGVGDYIYAVYQGATANSRNNVGGVQYQLATTIENAADEDSTFITGNYTQKRRGEDPLTLIGSKNNVLMDKQVRGQSNTDITGKTDAEASVIDGEITLINAYLTQYKSTFDAVEGTARFIEKVNQKVDQAKAKKDAKDYAGARESLQNARDNIKNAVDQVYTDTFTKLITDVDTALKSGQKKSTGKDYISKLRSAVDDLNQAQREYNKIIGQPDKEKKARILMGAAMQNSSQKLNNIVEEADREAGSGASLFQSLSNAPSLFSTPGAGASGTGAAVGATTMASIITDLNTLKGDADAGISDLQDEAKSLVVINAAVTNMIKDAEIIIDDIEDLEKITYTEEDIVAALNEAQREQSSGRFKSALEKALEAAHMFDPNVSTTIGLVYNEDDLKSEESAAGIVIDASNTSTYTGIPYPLDL